jgi:FtsH-binding integral membrane protein
MHLQQRERRSALNRQFLLLAQALVAILFVAVTVYALLALFGALRQPPDWAPMYLYFIAAIAALVFFHTLELHLREVRWWRVLLLTAVISIALSLLLFFLTIIVTAL